MKLFYGLCLLIPLFFIMSCDLLLGPATGTIEVTSNPSGATVYLDGKWTYQLTPAKLTDIPEGDHTIELSDLKSEGWQTRVKVEKNKTTYIHLDLISKVSISTNPPGAAIIINDSITGDTTPHTYNELPEKSGYTIRLVLANYFPFEVSWERQLGDVRDTSIILKPCPKYELLYASRTDYYDFSSHKIYTVGLDGINPHIKFENINNVAGLINCSPNGSYIAYGYGPGLGIAIIKPDGSTETNIYYNDDWSEIRPYDFAWSHSGRYLIYGHYYDGIYTYDVLTHQLKEIHNTSGQIYDHNPVFSPDDRWIAYVTHGWGYLAEINLMDSTGDYHSLSLTFEACCDAPLDISWISDSTIIFHANQAGIYSLNPFKPNQTPTRLIADSVYCLAVSSDRSLYAYCSENNGLHFGSVGNWSSTHIADIVGVKKIEWSPTNDAIIVVNAQGIYWIELNGTIYPIVSKPDGQILRSFTLVP